MRYIRWFPPRICCPNPFPITTRVRLQVKPQSGCLAMSSSDSGVRHLSQSPLAKRSAPEPSSADNLHKRVKFSHEPECSLVQTESGAVDDPVKNADAEQETAAVEQTGEDKNTAPRGTRDAEGSPRSRKGKSRAKQNIGRRRGMRAPSQQPHDGDEETQEGEQEQTSKAPRLPKRPTALLLGFCGTGCSGMQIQPNLRTIEGVLFEALVRAGAVSQDNADDPVKVNLGRAARTDAGVHAAGNLVSMKLITAIPGIKDWVGHVNSFLPPEIRVWGKIRVQNSFNARTSCDSRKYTYFFPTYLLLPPKPNTPLADVLHPAVSTAQTQTTSHPFWDIPSTTHEDDLARKRTWRVGTDTVEALKATVKKYEGTHNFHNFTVGREFSDRSNQRHMLRIEVSDPAVYGDTEWISVLFHGQSFMLHQRKMMSALVLSCRTGTPSQIIDELYGPRMVMVPKMPALGLLLEYPIFETYNKRVGTHNEKLDPSNVDYRPEIDFEVHRSAIDEFKQKYIYDNMRNTEDRCGIFDAWIRYVDSYEGNDLLYLNPRGIIPTVAVIKKGIKRPSPFREKKRFDITSLADIKQEGHTSIGDEAADEENEEEGLSKGRLEEMEG